MAVFNNGIQYSMKGEIHNNSDNEKNKLKTIFNVFNSKVINSISTSTINNNINRTLHQNNIFKNKSKLDEIYSNFEEIINNENNDGVNNKYLIRKRRYVFRRKKKHRNYTRTTTLSKKYLKKLKRKLFLQQHHRKRTCNKLKTSKPSINFIAKYRRDYYIFHKTKTEALTQLFNEIVENIHPAYYQIKKSARVNTVIYKHIYKTYMYVKRIFKNLSLLFE